MTEKKRILFISSLMMDDMYTFQGDLKDFSTTGKRPILEHTCAPGGNAITFTCAQRLGFSSVPVGMVGVDDMGKAYLRAIEKENISTEAIQVQRGYTTPVVMVLVDSSKKHAYLYISRKRLNEAANAEALVKSCDYLYISGFTLSTEEGNDENPHRTLAFARSAKKQGKPIFFDPGPMFDVMPPWAVEEALTLGDYNVMNQEEAEIVSHCSDPVEGALEIAQKYGCTAVVKMGQAGCAVSDGKGVKTFPAFSVPVVNTNGAGDTFIAGLMLGIANALSIDSAVTVANAAAAIKVSRGGAADRTPAFSEVKSFLEERGYHLLPSEKAFQ